MNVQNNLKMPMFQIAKFDGMDSNKINNLKSDLIRSKWEEDNQTAKLRNRGKKALLILNRLDLCNQAVKIFFDDNEAVFKKLHKRNFPQDSENLLIKETYEGFEFCEFYGYAALKDRNVQVTIRFSNFYHLKDTTMIFDYTEESVDFNDPQVIRTAIEVFLDK